jgi:putative N6-adenine-specific DNA methylase
MLSFQTESKIIITCPNRLAPYLELEIRELGFIPQNTFITGVELRGTLLDCIRLNLNLHCASQVLFSLKSFEANSADEVYQLLSQIDWENMLAPEAYFSITSNVMHPSINNSMYANLRVKDAIVDRLRDQTGTRPETGSELSGAVIHLFWKNERAEVFIDTSGHSLGRHGYRKIPGRAPMLEALAAAAVLATRWDRSTPFINPMCGSGTLAIEAAMIASNRRPGLFRDNYSFMHLLGYQPSFYEQERHILEHQVSDPIGLRIIASDYSDLAISNTRKNALAAGVEHLLEYEICDFAKTIVPENGQGIVLFNPEYGERLGEREELIDTYARIGDFLKKKCGGYWGYVFTGNLDLAKKIGLKPKRRIEFFNSTIDCRLLEYELYTGSKRIDRPPAD